MDTRRLESLLELGTDTALLRFTLGNAYLKSAQPERAIPHLEHAVALDPAYSAAWKALGKALAEAGRGADAARVYRSGIEAAQTRGDLQAAKEMQVFLRRIERER